MFLGRSAAAGGLQEKIVSISLGRRHAKRYDQARDFERAPHRSLLRACGVKEEDFDKPFIAICNSFVEIIPATCT